LLAAVALPVFAHSDAGAAGGFIAGLLHPVGGFDHVLAMIAVGLWGAQLGNPALWVLPVAFPMVMACGGFLGLIGIALPGVEIGIALSALVLGAAVLARARPALPLAAALVAIFAIFHGHAHGTELPAGADSLAYSTGFVIATGLLHGAGIALGLVQRLPFGSAILRGLGGIVLAGGLAFLYQALTG
jgi:urease accessory protein